MRRDRINKLGLSMTIRNFEVIVSPSWKSTFKTNFAQHAAKSVPAMSQENWAQEKHDYVSEGGAGIGRPSTKKPNGPSARGSRNARIPNERRTPR